MENNRVSLQEFTPNLRRNAGGKGTLLLTMDNNCVTRHNGWNKQTTPASSYTPIQLSGKVTLHVRTIAVPQPHTIASNTESAPHVLLRTMKTGTEFTTLKTTPCKNTFIINVSERKERHRVSSQTKDGFKFPQRQRQIRSCFHVTGSLRHSQRKIIT